MSLGGPNLIQYMFFGALDKSGAMNGKVTAHLGCLLGYIFEGIAPGHFGAKKAPPGGKKKCPETRKTFQFLGPVFWDQIWSRKRDHQERPSTTKKSLFGTPKTVPLGPKSGTNFGPKKWNQKMIFRPTFSRILVPLFPGFSVSFLAVLVPLFGSSVGPVCCLVAPRLRCGCYQVTL